MFGLREDKNRISNLALDRIIDFEKQEDVPYHRNREIDFEHYFDDIVGVTHPNGVEKEHIILKTTKNRFPYIVSKPIHPSQKVTNETEYELTLDVIPNKELDQQILSLVQIWKWYHQNGLESILETSSKKISKNIFLCRKRAQKDANFAPVN